MKEKIKSIPKPIKTQILIRFGIGFLSLVVAILMLVLAKDFVLSLPCWLLFVYMAVNGGIMLFNSLKGDFVAVTGTCTMIERSRFWKRVKVIYIQTEQGQMRVPIRRRIRRIDEGDNVTVYMPSKTRIYEQEDGLAIFGYYAIDITRQNILNSAQ